MATEESPIQAGKENQLDRNGKNTNRAYRNERFFVGRLFCTKHRSLWLASAGIGFSKVDNNRSQMLMRT
jgi:hypothetical protein